MQADRLTVFPAFHKVTEGVVLVVGDGAETAAKVRLLSETTARIRVVAPAPEADLAVLLGADQIEHRARGFDAADLEGAVLAFAASGDAACDRAVVAAARASRVPVNAVDQPDLCDFFTPALVNRAPVAVAITSTGAGPVLAQKIRARIEAMLPLRLGALAALAESFRPAAERVLPKGQVRRRFWAEFFDGIVSEATLAGRADEARRFASKLLNQPDSEPEGFVWLVGAGPGAADLLTLRAQRILGEADVIVHDALVPDAVIAMGRRDARRIPVGKRKGAHSASHAEIEAVLVREAKAGRRVVRLKGGDPLVFGRAGEEIAALREAGVPFAIIPGVTSALAAAAEAAIPLTLRGTASALVLAIGHDSGGATPPDWAESARSGATLAIYMGRSVAGDVAARLLEAGLSRATPVAVVENASLPAQRLLAGTLAELPRLAERDDLTGPTLIFVGDAVAAAGLAGAEPLSAPSVLAA
ncbi:siroheme synthase CysG [Faunimonas sp. B44]|uniref:siroheme synthase CysG n=1 Tax=Faunimonas sp. B44 TaxID=3461493 RepID=UPI00404517AE